VALFLSAASGNWMDAVQATNSLLKKPIFLVLGSEIQVIAAL
jgi:hypothetical protein